MTNSMGVRADRSLDGVLDRVEVASVTMGTADAQSLDDFLDSCQNRFVAPLREAVEGMPVCVCRWVRACLSFFLVFG